MICEASLSLKKKQKKQTAPMIQVGRNPRLSRPVFTVELMGNMSISCIITEIMEQEWYSRGLHCDLQAGSAGLSSPSSELQPEVYPRALHGSRESVRAISRAPSSGASGSWDSRGCGPPHTRRTSPSGSQYQGSSPDGPSPLSCTPALLSSSAS